MTVDRHVLRRCISAAAFLMAADWAVTQDECRLPEGTASTLESLYEQSLIADVPYLDEPIPATIPITDSCYLKTFTIKVKPLTSAQRKDIETKHEELVNTDLPANEQAHWQVDWYNLDDVDGVTYATCGDKRKLRLGFALFQVSRLDPDDNVFAFAGLILQAAFIAFSENGEIPEFLKGGKELIRFVHLETDPGDRRIAIRGTDFLKIPEVRTSLNDLSGDSCALSLAATAVTHFSEIGYGGFSVVGHSLGGIATQYVARDHAANLLRNPESVSYYSFSSIGANRSGIDSRITNLYSYFINGDIVACLGAKLGRQQIGRSMRYTIPDTRFDCDDFYDMWDYVANSVTVNLDDLSQYVERHYLENVQESICNCESGQGRVDSERS